VIAKLIELFGRIDGPRFLDAGKSGAFAVGKNHSADSLPDELTVKNRGGREGVFVHDRNTIPLRHIL
jgi:hypothetical protein